MLILELFGVGGGVPLKGCGMSPWLVFVSPCF